MIDELVGVDAQDVFVSPLAVVNQQDGVFRLIERRDPDITGKIEVLNQRFRLAEESFEEGGLIGSGYCIHELAYSYGPLKQRRPAFARTGISALLRHRAWM